MTDVQTSFDLRSAGEQEPTPEGASYPFQRTPMDDSYERALARRQEAEERRQYRALREWEAEHGA